MELDTKKNNGLIYSSLGMILTTFGLVLMTMDKSPWIYLTLCGLGVILAAFGAIKLIKSSSKK